MQSPAARTAVAPDPGAEEMSSRRPAGETLVPEVLGWVAGHVALPSTRGAYAGYDQWARRTDGVLSSQTVRNRLGTWAAVKRAAAVMVVAREQARPTAPSLTLAA